MALNSVQNSQPSMTATQLFVTISKAVVKYGKKEEMITAIAMLCALVVLIGAVLMSTVTMIAGAVVFVITFAPAIILWSLQDYNKEL